MHAESIKQQRGLFLGRVAGNRLLCREHFRLLIELDGFPRAHPGQFTHLACHDPDQEWLEPKMQDWPEGAWPASIGDPAFRGEWPFIRRAFSIAGLRKSRDTSELEIMYRVVGSGTRWMSRLKTGDCISVIGPLGNGFDWSDRRPVAYVVAGGIGLPPMRWLAESLHDAGKHVIAFCGSVTRDLMPLTFAGPHLQAVSTDPARPAMAAAEFAAVQTPVVITTDDGSLGVKGLVTDAMRRFHQTSCYAPGDVTVYSCGPDRMLKALSDICQAAGLACQLCMERSMACGTGTCQSCALPVNDPTAPDGWRYRLCCTDGPVFHAHDVHW